MQDNVFAPNVVQIVKEFETDLTALRTERATFSDAFKSGNMDLVRRVRQTTYQVAISKALATSERLVKATEEQVEEACYVTSNAEYDRSSVLLITIIAVVVVVLAIIAIIIVTGITKPLKKAVEAADKISHGDFKVNLETKSTDETGMLIHSMEHMVGSINSMANDINSSIHHALEGNLKYRSDASKHQGDYSSMIKGVNDLVDAFVEPITMCARTFDYIAAGSTDLSEISKEYKGDFNNIKNSINTAVRTLYMVLGEIAATAEAAAQGDLSKRADTSKVQGA